jgi:hypothetical protein
MFIQQIFRFTPSSTLRANEKLIIARRVAIAAYVSIVQDRSSYVRMGFYIGIRRSHAMFYSNNLMLLCRFPSNNLILSLVEKRYQLQGKLPLEMFIRLE